MSFQWCWRGECHPVACTEQLRSDLYNLFVLDGEAATPVPFQPLQWSLHYRVARYCLYKSLLNYSLDTIWVMAMTHIISIPRTTYSYRLWAPDTCKGSLCPTVIAPAELTFIIYINEDGSDRLIMHVLLQRLACNNMKQVRTGSTARTWCNYPKDSGCTRGTSWRLVGASICCSSWEGNSMSAIKQQKFS